MIYVNGHACAMLVRVGKARYAHFESLKRFESEVLYYMNTRMHVDVAVIGAGVVGCAIAQHLSETYPHVSIAVLEKYTRPGLETSSRNSGVLHSGFHERPGSLKAKLAREGSGLALAFAKSHNVPVLNCGMLIAVPREFAAGMCFSQVRNLWRLAWQGKRQNISFQLITPERIRRELELPLHTLFGVFIPSVCVVDAWLLTDELCRDAIKNLVKFEFGHSVEAVERTATHWRLLTNNGDYRADTVINAAGLEAHNMARMSGFADYNIELWRGEYYEVINREKANQIRRLVYPVMPKHSPGKGIHFSPRPDGKLFLGPNAKLVESKSYDENPTPPDEFLETARRFYPALEREDLRWSYAGIRPKLRTTAKEPDFVIQKHTLGPAWVNLIGIDSPGLSASLAIARHVVSLLDSEFRAHM